MIKICPYKSGIECHIRDYPILNCVDVKIEDCHYKQLQQLKAENESLKSLNDFNVQKIETLEAENEELKEIRENLHKCNKKIMDKKHNISIKNIKYKQCLDEIYKILDTYGNNGIELSVEKQECILQKIKQAKEGGE